MTATAAAARRREDLTAWFIFATLIAMSGILAAALLIEEQPYEVVVDDGVSRRIYQGHGVAHPNLAATRSETGDAPTPSMLYGGNGRVRHESIVVLACLFAVLSVVFGMAGIYLGTLKSSGPSPLKVPLIVAALLGCFVMVAMFHSYWRSLGSGDPGYFLGFPVPTAWMIYGVYFFPILVVIYFVCWFDRWYAPPQINEELRRIMSRAEHGEEHGEMEQD